MLNKYKHTLDDFIDSSNLKSPNWLGPIDEELCNVSKSEGSLRRFSERFYLDENFSNSSEWRLSETENFQVHQYRNITSLGHKSGRVQMEKVRGLKKMKKTRGVEKAVKEIR